VELAAYSVRSCVAPPSGSSSPGAFGVNVAPEATNQSNGGMLWQIYESPDFFAVDDTRLDELLLSLEQ